MENQNPAATNLEEEVKQLRKENNQLVELVEELNGGVPRLPASSQAQGADSGLPQWSFCVHNMQV